MILFEFNFLLLLNLILCVCVFHLYIYNIYYLRFYDDDDEYYYYQNENRFQLICIRIYECTIYIYEPFFVFVMRLVASI